MAFLSQALSHGQHIAASYKPNTAVTDWVERLCSSSYQLTEYEGIPELVDSINLQSTGPSEAARMLRKKLKYGNTHMQCRAIFLIKCLVENCGERTNFQKTFPDPTLVERLKILAGDPQTDPKVKKILMSTLKGFHQQFNDDRSMKVYANWWDEVGGARGEADERARISYAKERERLDKESQLRLDEKMARRLQGEEDDHAATLREQRRKQRELRAAAEATKAQQEAARARADQMRAEERAREETRQKEKEERERQKRESKKGGFFGSSSSAAPASKTAKRAPFNFEQEKPKITQAVATASMYANGLVNALQHVNREKESVADNARAQNQLQHLKDARKQIVRYIQLCEVDKEGDYIGMLISSNDQIVAALQLYDRMLTKPADEDSDDERFEEAQAAKASQTPATPADSATSADQLAKDLQKVSVNNASLQSFGELDKLRDRQRTEIYRHQQGRQAAGLPTPGIYGDLQGLNFGGSPGSSLPPPMNPQHAVETRDAYGSGNLSDYSDYSSSDEDDYRPSASTSNNKAWKDFVPENERAAGGLLDPDDPFADTAEATTPGVYSKPRAHVWAEI